LIAVLGRGKSLLRYCDRDWEQVYLVNNMTEELPRLKFNYSGKITQVCGRKGATVMEKSACDWYGINDIISNALTLEHVCNIKRHYKAPTVRPAIMNQRGYPPMGWKAILKGKTKSPKSDNGRCWPTTGLFAIDLALAVNKPKEIHLFGFDFYKRNYLIKKNRPYQTQKNPKIKMMYVCLEALVREFCGTMFYCYSDIEINSKNWVVL